MSAYDKLRNGNLTPEERLIAHCEIREIHANKVANAVIPYIKQECKSLSLSIEFPDTTEYKKKTMDVITPKIKALLSDQTQSRNWSTTNHWRIYGLLFAEHINAFAAYFSTLIGGFGGRLEMYINDVGFWKFAVELFSDTVKFYRSRHLPLIPSRTAQKGEPLHVSLHAVSLGVQFKLMEAKLKQNKSKYKNKKQIQIDPIFVDKFYELQNKLKKNDEEYEPAAICATMLFNHCERQLKMALNRLRALKTSHNNNVPPATPHNLPTYNYNTLPPLLQCHSNENNILPTNNNNALSPPLVPPHNFYNHNNGFNTHTSWPIPLPPQYIGYNNTLPLALPYNFYNHYNGFNTSLPSLQQQTYYNVPINNIYGNQHGISYSHMNIRSHPYHILPTIRMNNNIHSTDTPISNNNNETDELDNIDTNLIHTGLLIGDDNTETYNEENRFMNSVYYDENLDIINASNEFVNSSSSLRL
eukprot:146601_1